MRLRATHVLGARLALGAVLALSGCPSPMLHPLRASNGPYVAAAAFAAVPGGRRGQCYELCLESQGTPATPAVAAAAGYGHVFGNVGVQGGAYALAFGNGHALDALDAFGLFGFFTLQNRLWSVGAGPELTGGGASITMGGEFRHDVPSLAFIPTVGVFARWFVPLPRGTVHWYAPDTPTLEIGVRARWGELFVQYEYYTNMERRVVIPAFGVEGSVFGEGFHLFAIGGMVDGEEAQHRRAQRVLTAGPR
jgi:hypothetical protein